jgi:uncharacterized membrane protein HdeD (DUF308 family)
VLHEHWGVYLVEGILLVMLGVAAIVVPSWATVTVAISLGWRFLLSGFVGLITTFCLIQAPDFWWSLLSVVLAVVVGALLIGWPVSGAISLTLALLIYFAAEGIFSIMSGLEYQRALSGRWSWLVIKGIIDLFLVGVILFGFPVPRLECGGFWYGGAALIGLSLTAHRSKSA